MKKTDLIPGLLKEVFTISQKEKLPPLMVAYKIAKQKIERAKNANRKTNKKN